MKKIAFFILLSELLLCSLCKSETYEWIRINQLGYRNNDIKVAVLLSRKKTNLKFFRLVDVKTGKTVMTFETKPADTLEPFITCYRLPFTKFKKTGVYRIVAGDAVSPDFPISRDVYAGKADFLLNYMRQQRSGYNPFVKDSCHTHDGYVVYGKSADSAHVNVAGGWHDAADYLQYTSTSSNATYQMLFAYTENPGAFDDKFLANGLPGKDGLPDVLNESKWGLDWLLKMNPKPETMYNQIADDRDHTGFRFPDDDTAHYGKGLERPVYLCTGKPQGLFKYKNRTSGIASTAGKFASAFAKGAQVYKNISPEYAKLLFSKAIDAYNYGMKNPGACQTAPGTAPYFYEEDNWVDDMELAAIELYNITRDTEYLKNARDFGRQEKVTPWIGSDTAHHYQWYPFVNMGHPEIARTEKEGKISEFAGYMKKGLALTAVKADKNPFHIGVPFIWCSNNLVAGILTQAHLYTEITGDSTYEYLEAAHRDWLFGCNPWGTSMIVGLPEKGDSPMNSHSSYVVKGLQVYGGLVDGPVYSSIFNSLKYIYLSEKDEYSESQTKMAVYHDDYADYSTNECTMDGTASLVYYLSSLQPEKNHNPDILTSHGAIVRMDTTKKNIYFCFTAHDFTDGFDTILSTLAQHKIKASFFLTGDFCRNKSNRLVIEKLKADGHYIGPHSDKHLLYCSWEKRDSLLITKKEFLSDLLNNYRELSKHGIPKKQAMVFLPPYEWYNDTIASWTSQQDIQLVENSSGTSTAQDWTFPDKSNPYFPSDALMEKLLSYENKKGLNGFILLIHPGTDPRRKDKFYFHLDEIIKYLENKKYSFHSFTEIN
jgi:peptidoglycan/xylan/chitin deacetylase (PgdA/CDA1 family)